MSKLILSPIIKTRENRHWDWTSNPILTEEQPMVCPYTKCGKIFNRPIELTVRTNGSLETYYACPHCFSRVNVLDNLKKSVGEASLSALKEPSKGTEKNDAAGCTHFIGYLKTRPKDSPIPDECLTCSKILKCM